MFRYKHSFICAFLLLTLPWQALATRIETLRWSHSTPEDVDGFILHYGTSSGNYTSTKDLGKPPVTGDLFTYDFTVPEFQTLYVALTAYGEGFLESPLSNEKVLLGAALPPAPPLGSIWKENFEGVEVGSTVPFWQSTGSNNSLNEDTTLFKVGDLNSNRVLTTSVTQNNFHSHYQGAGSQNWTEYEVSGLLGITDTRGGVGITAYSQYPNENGYYRLRTFNGNPFELEPHGAVASCANSSLGFVLQANSWIRFRLRVSRVGDNNEISAKTWPDGSQEPDWQVTCVDPNPTYRRGTVGVWAHGPGTKYWDDLEVSPLNQELSPIPAPILLPANEIN